MRSVCLYVCVFVCLVRVCRLLLLSVVIPPEKVNQLQLNLIRSHAAGVGHYLPLYQVRNPNPNPNPNDRPDAHAACAACERAGEGPQRCEAVDASDAAHRVQ